MLQSNSYIVLDPCNLHACSPPLDLTIKDVQRGGPAPFCPNGQSKPVLHCRPPRRKVNLQPIPLKKSFLPSIQQFWNSSQHNGFALNPKTLGNLCNPSKSNPNELCKPCQESNQNRRPPNKCFKIKQVLWWWWWFSFPKEICLRIESLKNILSPEKFFVTKITSQLTNHRKTYSNILNWDQVQTSEELRKLPVTSYLENPVLSYYLFWAAWIFIDNMSNK